MFDVHADERAVSQVTQLLGKEGIERTFAPMDKPSGLPETAYSSEEWLRLENERIFGRTWVFAGAEGELAAVGSIKTMVVAGVPIILVRGEDGVVRAFHNVCRHRGTKLVGESCRVKTIVCPYHAWTYGLDGSLMSRAHFQRINHVERFRAGGVAEANLHAIRCESWNSCLFVNISGTAPPLTHWLQPMLDRVSEFDFSMSRWIGKKMYRIKSNWKLAVENFMEGYHVFAAHPRLLAHAPMSVRWSGEWDRHVFRNGYLAPRLSEGRGDGLPHYPNLSEETKRRGFWFVCFPTMAVEVYADQFVVLVSYPISANETVEELHFFVCGDEAASADRYAAGREELTTMWHELNLEDIGILERLQSGRESRGFEGAVLSPVWDAPVQQFSEQIVNAIVAA